MALIIFCLWYLIILIFSDTNSLVEISFYLRYFICVVLNTGNTKAVYHLSICIPLADLCGMGLSGIFVTILYTKPIIICVFTHQLDNVYCILIVYCMTNIITYIKKKKTQLYQFYDNIFRKYYQNTLGYIKNLIKMY